MLLEQFLPEKKLLVIMLLEKRFYKEDVGKKVFTEKLLEKRCLPKNC
jgi:hypothetical protein